MTHLDEADTRALMRAEVEADMSSTEGIYRSKYFSDKGFNAYKSGVLLEAVDSYDDEWLAAALDQPGYFAETYPRNNKNGVSMVKVPYTASQTLAEGELNRYYIRAVCLRAINAGMKSLRVYRAKNVAQPRPESEQLIDKKVDPATVLADLRNNPGANLVEGLPSGPNSGLSVQFL